MTARAVDLAKLLTIDMARVCAADDAVRNAIRKHDFQGKVVLSAGALASDVAVVMRRLDEAGGITVDFTHGWSGEPEPFVEEPPCSYRCVWARTDVAEGPVRFLVGGMPIPLRLPRQPHQLRPRILVMSNYVHRDYTAYQMGMDAYQAELLDVIYRRADNYAFRWRPHPADRPELVSRAAAGLPAELSRGRSLAEDFAWADIVVSTISTALPQALLLDLPVLVHVTPDLEGAPLTSPFSSARTFFRAADGAEKLDAIVAALSQPDLLAPEKRARSALFGEKGTPLTLEDAIASLACNGAVASVPIA